MTRYLLDTNIAITVAELRYGVAKSAWPEQNREKFESFIERFEIVDFSEEAAAAYGRIRASLESAGTPIGPLDTLIAAHALSLVCTLVTNNAREFQRVPGLNIENWTE